MFIHTRRDKAVHFDKGNIWWNKVRSRVVIKVGDEIGLFFTVSLVQNSTFFTPTLFYRSLKHIKVSGVSDLSTLGNEDGQCGSITVCTKAVIPIGPSPDSCVEVSYGTPYVPSARQRQGSLL